MITPEETARYQTLHKELDPILTNRYGHREIATVFSSIIISCALSQSDPEAALEEIIKMMRMMLDEQQRKDS